MILSTWQIWVIAILLPIILLLIIPKKIKDSEKFTWLGIVILLLPICLAVYCSWFCPNVYYITSCSEYSKKILLIPKSINQTKLSLGNKCYIVNHTDKSMLLNTKLYLKETESNNLNTNKAFTIKPQSVFEYEENSIDFIFEEFPISVTAKSRDEAKLRSQITCNTP